MILIEISNKRLSVDQAVQSYLFNSQIVTKKDGKMALIAAIECEQQPAVYQIIQEILEDPNNPIDEAHFFNLTESMQNGGGPACLRLRSPLSEKQIKRCHQGVFFSELLYQKLKEWINRWYRDRLLPEDFADPLLFEEVTSCLQELKPILDL